MRSSFLRVSILICSAILVSGCANHQRVHYVSAELVEYKTGFPLVASSSLPRRVVVNGSRAEQLGRMFPELAEKSATSIAWDDSWRFKLKLTRTDGVSRIAEIDTDRGVWRRDGFDLYALSTEARWAVLDLIRESKDNPLLTILLQQSSDEQGRYFERALVTFVTRFDAIRLARRFPELGQKQNQVAGSDLKGWITLVFLYADGRTVRVVVSKDMWAESGINGDVARWPLAPDLSEELHRIIGGVGKVAAPTTRMSELR